MQPPVRELHVAGFSGVVSSSADWSSSDMAPRPGGQEAPMENEQGTAPGDKFARSLLN